MKDLGHQEYEIEDRELMSIHGEMTKLDEVRKDSPGKASQYKETQKMMGKIAWLANSIRPDLAYTALLMLKTNNAATISDLRDINRTLKKVKERGTEF